MATSTSPPKPKKGEKKGTTSMEISDYWIGRLLGEGAFARVYHVKQKDNNQEYALKVMEKQFILKHKKTKEVQMERKVLSEVNHPNIVKLHFSFHDKERLYMVIDLCPCGELAKLIRHKRSEVDCLSEEDTKFYVGETCAALKHLHSLKIVHRDLKPENVLIDASGHVKLTDFGTAKDMNEEVKKKEQPNDNVVNDGGANGNNHDDDNNNNEDGAKRKDTFCGTAEYVSPEVLQEGKASYPTDIWALGILTFACLTGRTPFLGESEYLTFQRILYYCGVEQDSGDLLITEEEKTKPSDLKFPSTKLSPTSLDFVKKLLMPHPTERLTIAQIKAHAFFSGVDVESLHTKPPPALPNDFRKPLPTPNLNGAGTDWLMSEDGGDDILSEFGNLNRSGSGRGSQGSGRFALDGGKSNTPPASPSKNNNKRRSLIMSLTSSPQLPALTSFDQFLNLPNEKILLDGPVLTRGSMVTRKRHLVLTNLPRVFYVDVANGGSLKEQVMLTKVKGVAVNVGKNGKDFDVCIEFLNGEKRNFYFKDVMGAPQRWKKAFTELLEGKQ